MNDVDAPDTQLQLNRLTSDNAAQLQKIVQLENQLRQVEQIAQEKHMEIQRLSAEHEEAVARLKDEIEEASRQTKQQQPKPKDAVREGLLITKEELASVRQDMDIQERIVAVLERENAQLIQEKKAILSRLKSYESDMTNAGAKHSIQQSGGGGAATIPIAGGANAAQQLNNSNEMVSATSHEQTVRQAQELRLQLQRSQTIELELRMELDTCKKERRDAERRAAANDVTKVESAELEARALRVQLKRQDEQHHEMVQDMARKIAWYVENQTFNRAQEDLLKEQQETIQKLRVKLMESGGGGVVVGEGGKISTTAAGNSAENKDKTTIRQLQRQVQELEIALKEKNPNSIAQLIRSCQPPVQHSAIFKELDAKVKSLTEQLQERDAQHTAVMDRLRVESDKVRTQYQQRLEKLEKEMKERILNAQTRKVKELEKQLVDSRKFYTDKIREQEQSIVLLRRGIQPPSRSNATAARNLQHAGSENHHGEEDTNANNSLNEVVVGGVGGSTTATGKTPQQRQQAQRSVVQSRYLSHRGGGGPYPTTSTSCQTDIGGDVTRPFPTERIVSTTHVPSTASPNFTNTVIALQQENVTLKQQLEALAQSTLASVTAAPPSMAASSFQLASSLQAQIQALHNELALSRRLLMESQEEGRARANQHEDRLLRARHEHQQELRLVREEHAEEMKRVVDRHRAELKAVVDRVDVTLAHQARDVEGFATWEAAHNNQTESHNDINKPSSASNNKTKTFISHSGNRNMQQYLTLVTQQLHVLEHRQTTREMELAREVEEIQRVAKFEIAVERQKAELMLQQKNHEIDQFRLELDTLLKDMAALQMVTTT